MEMAETTREEMKTTKNHVQRGSVSKTSCPPPPPHTHKTSNINPWSIKPVWRSDKVGRLEKRLRSIIARCCSVWYNTVFSKVEECARKTKSLQKTIVLTGKSIPTHQQHTLSAFKGLLCRMSDRRSFRFLLLFFVFFSVVFFKAKERLRKEKTAMKRRNQLKLSATSPQHRALY